ncbi:MAG TPA: hypothetical protein VKP60_08235 [Magnetospirillaceae bacterium]|nr:hypothetical protein [Magnetospirillaceae bacterium]
MKIGRIAVLALALGLAGCGDWLSGREEQEIIVKTEPAGADCAFERRGVPIAHLAPTPGSVYIVKTSYAITVTCQKEGYQTRSVVNESDTNGATLLRVVLLGPLDWPAESIIGSDNKYQHHMMVTLPRTDSE